MRGRPADRLGPGQHGDHDLQSLGKDGRPGGDGDGDGDEADLTGRPAPQHVVTDPPDLRRLLALGDFLIGQPGSVGLCEAVQAGLPVITVCNAWTRPHERYNTDWVRQNGLGLVGSRWRQMRPLVRQLLDALPAHQAAVGRMTNRAVHEVPDILARVLAGVRAPARRPEAEAALLSA